MFELTPPSKIFHQPVFLEIMGFRDSWGAGSHHLAFHIAPKTQEKGEVPIIKVPSLSAALPCLESHDFRTGGAPQKPAVNGVKWDPYKWPIITGFPSFFFTLFEGGIYNPTCRGYFAPFITGDRANLAETKTKMYGFQLPMTHPPGKAQSDGLEDGFPFQRVILRFQSLGLLGSCRWCDNACI